MRTRTRNLALLALGLPVLLSTQACRQAPSQAPANEPQAPVDAALVERTIRDSPLLAKQEQQMAQLLARAQASAPDAQSLLAAQQQWLVQRNARCHDKPTARDTPEVSINNCLRMAFEQRIAALVELAYPPLAPVAVREIPASVLQQLVTPADCLLAQGAFAQTGPGQARALALEVNCGDEARRVWLIGADGQRATPATPELGGGDPNGELVYLTGTDLLWQGETLYVATSMETRPADSSEPYWDARYFIATPGSPPKTLAALPASVQQRLDNPPDAFDGDAYALTGDDNLLDESVRTVGHALVWASVSGQDDAILYSRPLDGKGQTREITRGPIRMLGAVQSDSKRLIHYSEFGLLLHVPDTNTTRRIAATGLHHVPLAWDPGTRQLAWISEVPCSGGAPTRQAHLCIATLPEATP